MNEYTLIDLAIIAIVVIFVWRGARRGLIMSIAGLLAIVAAFWVAGYAADKYAGDFTGLVAPYVEKAVGNSQELASVEASASENGTQDGEGYTVPVIKQALESLGFTDGIAQNLSETADEAVGGIKDTLTATVESILTQTISHIAVFVVVFFLVIIVVAVIARVINTAFKLPGLNLINGLGGAAIGLILGLAIVFIASWVIGYLGLFIPAETVEKTVLLKFFMNTNPFTIIFGM